MYVFWNIDTFQITASRKYVLTYLRNGLTSQCFWYRYLRDVFFHSIKFPEFHGSILHYIVREISFF